jgi:hypothetical protein
MTVGERREELALRIGRLMTELIDLRDAVEHKEDELAAAEDALVELDDDGPE